MNCKKVLRLLPLMIGSDLSRSRISSIRSHIDSCPGCRQEYEFYRLSMKKTKEWLSEDQENWDETDWKNVIQSVIKETSPKASHHALWPKQKRWAYTLVATAGVFLILVVLNISFLKRTFFPETKKVSSEQIQVAQSIEGEAQKKTTSMTFISQETGLKIKWFFVQDFNLEVQE